MQIFFERGQQLSTNSIHSLDQGPSVPVNSPNKDQQLDTLQNIYNHAIKINCNCIFLN